MNYAARRSLLYHNGMIWPFVQGYWAWAAADSRDLPTFDGELVKLLNLSQKTNTFKEFYFPEQGRPDGSADQLWSASGYLSMILHGLLGIDFEENGIRFAPLVPARFSSLSLSQINYRYSVLNLRILGHGKNISSFKLDGTVLEKPFLDAALTGTHQIEIQLRD
jgi:glycogen debranching enzyme